MLRARKEEEEGKAELRILKKEPGESIRVRRDRTKLSYVLHTAAVAIKCFASDIQRAQGHIFEFSVLVKAARKTTDLTSSGVPLCRQKSPWYWMLTFKLDSGHRGKLAEEVYFKGMLR